jgi:protein arginine N-methyltransferase 1
MFPSHTNMYLAPIADEEERKASAQEYSNAMADWFEFAETTKAVYGVDMSILEHDFEREQKEYYVYSSKWAELPSNAVLAEPVMIKHLDMATCTLEDARGIPEGAPDASFSFEIQGTGGPISGFAGWFTADFKSRTDTDEAPTVSYPAFLSTGPENGYTHWGQQVFYLPSPIPVLRGEVTHLQGSLQMTRTKANARLYNCKIIHKTSRCKVKPDGTQVVLCQSDESTHVYQIP